MSCFIYINLHLFQFVQYIKTNACLDSSADDTLNLAADVSTVCKLPYGYNINRANY